MKYLFLVLMVSIVFSKYDKCANWSISQITSNEVKACFDDRLEKIEEFENVKEPDIREDLDANTVEKIY